MYAMPGANIIPYRGTSPTLGKGVFLASGANVIGDLVLGEDVSVWFNAVVRADCHWIRIGARTNIQDNAVIHVTNGRFPTTIAEDVTVGHSAVIHGCTVERGSLIGMGAVLLDGAVIGEQSFVAAGAIVTPGKIFPPRSMIMGSPAKVTRSLSDSELQMLERSVSYYLEYKSHYIPT